MLKAIMDKILKDSKIAMTKSLLGDILPKTPETNSGCFTTGISTSMCDMAVVEWHGEAGSKELHNPCALYRGITARAGYTDVPGEASHQAGRCCLLATATAQTPRQCCSRGTRATCTRSTQPGCGADTLPVQDFCRKAISSLGWGCNAGRGRG